jgi:hypothetical protein
MTALEMPADIYSELMDHLAAEDVEHVAFLFTGPPEDGEALRVKEIYRVPPEGFEYQSSYHVALTDDVRGQVIKRAWDLDGCLVEVHSHGGDLPPSFSGSDLRGFREWVPHVRWRLGRRTYVALVFASTDFDALVWDNDEPTPLSHLLVDGREAQAPSGITYGKLVRAR